MPLPAGVTTRNVHIDCRDLEGAPRTGTVMFRPTVPRLVTADGEVVLSGMPISEALDSGGEATLTVPDTDNDLVGGPFQYMVTLSLRDEDPLNFLIDVPAGAAPLELASVTPAATVAPGSVSPVVSVNGQTGIVTLTAAGLGAELAGTAATALAGHVAALDPHGDRANAASALALHEADTTNIHGIADTAALETTAGSAAKVSAHAAAVDPHSQYLTSAEGDAAYARLAASNAFTGLQIVNATGGTPGSLPIGVIGAVNTGLQIVSSYAGGDDDGVGTDSTGRLNLYSYQRASSRSFGENIRNYAMRADAKTMQAFYIPVQSSTKKGGYDPTSRDPLASGIGWKPVVWQGSHYEANDHGSVHGHWELEIADSTGALQGRLEIPFIDQATDGGKALDQVPIGVDYTNIRTNLADLSVRAQNMATGPYSGQNTCFRIGGSNAVNKDVALSISSDMGTSGRRWILRANTTTEAGSNAGTDFQIRRYDDGGTFLDASLHIERSTGRIGTGGVTSPTAGLHVQRATGQVVYVDALASSQSAVLVNGVDATVKAIQSQVAGDTQKRFQFLVDGAHSWGPGGSTAPDTTLYRSAAGLLRTDTGFRVGTQLSVGAAANSSDAFTASLATDNNSLYLINTAVGGNTASPHVRMESVTAGSLAVTERVTGDSVARFAQTMDGQMGWGSGAATRDTNLYRSAADVLRTDDTFHVGTNLRINTTSVAAGVGVLAMANASTLPTATPTGGGVIYVEAGALKYKGSGGTITTLGAA